MIVGSGMIATALRSTLPAHENTCVYAAGVSNSACTNPVEFRRESERLAATISALPSSTKLVYFGTCSVFDPDAMQTPYVRHKLEMEAAVASRGSHLILRLPQVVGTTPNPHTLFNYLYARIARSERFVAWRQAVRYIIHVDEAASIATDLLTVESAEREIINVAAPRPYSIFEIISALESHIGKEAVMDVVDRGSRYSITTGRIESSIARCKIEFGSDYLARSIARTYSPLVGSPELH